MIDEEELADGLLARFLRYVKIWTTSDASREETPSTPGQWDLARLLAAELEGLGLEAEVTEHCYVLARIPATPGREEREAIGFLAHLDTAGGVPGKDVNPQKRVYQGEVIQLRGGLSLDPSCDPDLAAQKGRTIIHTDGSTLLGADDKAGVAEIMSCAACLRSHPEIVHGPLYLCFTPDEEGKGISEADFPRAKFPAAACYTVDGGGLGEFEAECFNAWSAVIRFQGKVIHPGRARGVLVNAGLMAASYAGLLPRSESPEATDGFYGYYHLTDISGSEEEAKLTLILRDFESAGMERRLAALQSFARAVEAQFPGGKVGVETKMSYLNMRQKIERTPAVLDKLKAAACAAGVPYTLKPIRGGTDGSHLSEMGIPTPNIFTGGHNFHSRTEWASLYEMTAACRLLLCLAREWA